MFCIRREISIKVGSTREGGISAVRLAGSPMEVYRLPYGPYGNLVVSIGPLYMGNQNLWKRLGLGTSGRPGYL